MTALRYDDPMPPPQRLPESLEVMPGLKPVEYLAAFMREFDAGPKETVLWTTVAAQKLAISGNIFRKQSGVSKLTKRGRQVFVRYLARGIKDPDEVWYIKDQAGKEFLYYIARFAGREPVATQAVFRWNGKLWEPVTGYQQGKIKYVERQASWLRSAGTIIHRR